MSTSGTTTFNLKVDDVIEEAYDRCGIETRSGYDLKTARRSLNLLLQGLVNEHIPLWKIELTTKSLVQGTENYALDSKILDVSDVVLRRDGTDTVMLQLSRNEYNLRPNKTTQSRPSQYYFEKTVTPSLYIYPSPENSTDTLIFYAKEKIEDVTEYTQEIDVPTNVLPVIVSGLAYMISVKRDVERSPLLKALYDEDKNRLKTENTESGSVSIIPMVTRNA